MEMERREEQSISLSMSRIAEKICICRNQNIFENELVRGYVSMLLFKLGNMFLNEHFQFTVGRACIVFSDIMKFLQ